MNKQTQAERKHRHTISVALSQMVKDGTVRRVGRGQYQIAAKHKPK